jgi:MoaA/NifB/PqqE/SkfB family radical SAM enzyme
MSITKKFLKSLDKEFLLNDSKTFCIVPWVHIHTNPSGIATPCCIAESCTKPEGVGNAREQSLMEIVNSESMNKLRTDMLSETKNSECTKCYEHEDQGIKSFRNMINSEFSHQVNSINATKKDGSLSEFKMRYFDIRFNNICNFKCRTCGSGFSTQWEQEDLKNKVWNAKVIPKNDNKEFLGEVVDQIQNIETAYFAGGEPLLTEEHYILLEEMIRSGKTDIKLRYNTNLSNLKFKDKDLLSLWKHFNTGVDIYASIDHYGDRAEYIRHGTDWGVVESNFKLVKQTPSIRLHMNTVLSVFNVLTIHEFYQYLYDNDMYSNKDSAYMLYNMSTPEFLACHILPSDLKIKAKESLEKTVNFLKSKRFRVHHIQQISDAIPWAMSKDSWDQTKVQFRNEVKRLDKIRDENFKQTFPELAILLEPEYKRLWPV